MGGSGGMEGWGGGYPALGLNWHQINGSGFATFHLGCLFLKEAPLKSLVDGLM